jgi:uncharacterized membrane protein
MGSTPTLKALCVNLVRGQVLTTHSLLYNIAMRRLIFFIFSFLFLFFASTAKAQSLEYKSFDSKIKINQDYSIDVTETVLVNFTSSHHGIFRNIPEGNVRVLSITDEKGTGYIYKVSGGNVKQIKIGDPDNTISGVHTYMISYHVRDAIKEFSDHFELYWNITGSDWDNILPTPTANISSPFAKITKIQCFAGEVGTSLEACSGSFTDNEAQFSSKVNTGVGSDFTVVLALDKNNNFISPTPIQRIIYWLLDNWYFLLTPLPLLIPLFFWFKRGRDQRYVSENIYYEPSDQKTRTVGLFERKFLPLVYSPIKGLTPAQVGTIIDEKVDLADVVAEIMELAHLRYMKIKRIPKKGLFGKDDYEFTKTSDDTTKLTKYQQIIMDGLFESGSPMLLSDLKNKFYKDLKSFKDELYENMKENKFFDDNPESVRSNWVGIIIFMGMGIFFLINVSSGDTNGLAVFLTVIFGGIGYLFARAMPRRTPHGYALYRQIEGLKWYINKGLWRQEIAEKRLFIDEILPLAITLGVVDKLTHDMKDLGIEPPKYISGVTSGNFASSLSSFQSSAGSALASAPGGSGGSGFSGGSSRGGGGGGGGGGW